MIRLGKIIKLDRLSAADPLSPPKTIETYSDFDRNAIRDYFERAVSEAERGLLDAEDSGGDTA